MREDRGRRGQGRAEARGSARRWERLSSARLLAVLHWCLPRVRGERHRPRVEKGEKDGSEGHPDGEEPAGGFHVRIVMDSMKQRLEMVGMTMDDLVNVRVYCPDLSLYDKFNAVYRTYFKEHFPARAFIGSGPLLLGGRFEVTGITAGCTDLRWIGAK